ncbi:hypothetical protein IZY60_10110 [Lutibacter sp. B2]|nr:hypothetical protein [Lutibacter sp. B2]
MKKFISVILTLSMLLTFSLCQVSFASEKIINKGTINGETFTAREIENNSQVRIVTVENNTSIIKAIYDKNTNKIKLSRLAKSESKARFLSNQSFDYITTINLSQMNELSTRSGYSYKYVSEYYSKYKYNIIKASNSGRIFNLAIPNDRLTTPIVSDGRIMSSCYEFEEDLKSADSHTSSAIRAGCGFIPGVGTCVSVASILESLSFEDLSKADYISAVISAVELVPGIGQLVNMADFGSHASLAGAQLFNTRQDFRNVKKRI